MAFFKAGVRTAIFAVMVQALAVVSAKAETVAVDAELLQKLQQIIEQQQEKLDAQSETIDSLKTRVEQLEEPRTAAPAADQTQTIERLKARIDQLEQQSTETKAIASEAQSNAEKAIVSLQDVSPDRDTSELVRTDNPDKVKLAISGHINRATNIADDGSDTKVYFVDNDVSDSRVRFVGTGQINKETTGGSVMELGFSPNNSFDVSQDNESPDDFLDVRKAEGFFRNDNYGQIMFGKGQASADDTAEYDLSLVAGPLMYSGVADPVGGLQFTDNDGDLTGVTVGDAFFNFDGDRQDRVRYDTPVVGPGLQLSGSVGDDQRYDVALTWGGDYGDWTGVEIGPFTTLGAVSLRDPSEDDVDWRLAGSFSALHNPTGLSGTISGGMDSNDDQDDPYNLYGKLAWDTQFFDLGQTGFGLDFTYTEHTSGEDDEGISLGFAVIQLIEDHGIELYAQVRGFDLDRDDGSAEDVVVGTVGTRVKF